MLEKFSAEELEQIIAELSEKKLVQKEETVDAAAKRTKSKIKKELKKCLNSIFKSEYFPESDTRTATNGVRISMSKQHLVKNITEDIIEILDLTLGVMCLKKDHFGQPCYGRQSAVYSEQEDEYRIMLDEILKLIRKHNKADNK